MRNRHIITAVITLTAVFTSAFWLFSRYANEQSSPGTLLDDDSGTSGIAYERTLDGLLDDPAIPVELVRTLKTMQAEILEQRKKQLELEEKLTALNFASVIPTPETSAEVDAQVPETASEPRTSRPSRGASVSTERLIAAGFNQVEAEQIVRRADQTAMERLNLQYKATREGWIGTPRYREEMVAMPSTRDVVVEDYGEDGYDRYLYASGRPNRVVVNDIYTESVAASAGLQSGDMVVAMDNQRIYSTRDLRNIAASGLEGETVSVTILRDGQPFEIYVPRGPLGIRSERGFENPAAQP